MLKCTQVKLHPASYRHLANSHPWVIKDEYTERFGAKARLLITDDSKKRTYTLIADSAHPKIKARLWSKHDSSENFFDELSERLDHSFLARKELITSNTRSNIMLAFGESDHLPGLLILFLAEGIVIQSYCGFWKKIQKDLVKMIRDKFDNHYSELNFKWLGWQDRDHSQKADIKPLWGNLPGEVHVKEFDQTYLIKLKSGYDLGIYTDMAALRNQYQKSFQQKRVLNLYAYTGAWSVFSLANHATHCTSIDLSSKYMDWLEHNLELNQLKDHTSIVGDVNKELDQLIGRHEKFDMIICDPPSFSSDGKKTTSSLDNYPLLLGKLSKLMNDNASALIFLNTHKIIRKKFESQIKNSLKKNRLTIKQRLFLQQDCPLIKGFPEGDYLKGLEISKKDLS